MKTYEERVSELDHSIERNWVHMLSAVTTIDIMDDNWEAVIALARQRGDKENPVIQKAREFMRMQREVGEIVRAFQKKM